MAWWEALTASGGERHEREPRDIIPRRAKGLIQPALKVRGREYLRRIIHGPKYDLPANPVRLRQRGLGGRRAEAPRDVALAEALRANAGVGIGRTRQPRLSDDPDLRSRFVDSLGPRSDQANKPAALLRP